MSGHIGTNADMPIMDVINASQPRAIERGSVDQFAS